MGDERVLGFLSDEARRDTLGFLAQIADLGMQAAALGLAPPRLDAATLDPGVEANMRWALGLEPDQLVLGPDDAPRKYILPEPPAGSRTNCLHEAFLAWLEYAKELEEETAALRADVDEARTIARDVRAVALDTESGEPLDANADESWAFPWEKSGLFVAQMHANAMANEAASDMKDETNE